jgi:glycosyltransferase involved in cell wall biosynthesis
MKVVFVGLNGYDFPYTRVRCYHFAAELRRHGIDADVLSFQHDLAPDLKGEQMLGLPERMRMLLTIRALLRLAPMKDVLFYVQKVHYHAAVPHILARLGRNRYVLDYDDWDVDRSPLFRNPFLNRAVFQSAGADSITRAVANRAVACVASSRRLERYLLESNPRTFYVPTGVSTERFAAKIQKTLPPGRPVRFLWSGQVWGRVIYDNLVYLTECFASALAQGPAMSLLVVGRGEWMDRFRARVDTTWRTLPIEIRGWVAPDDMPALLADADVGLTPLISDRDNREWMLAKSPTKHFEYMSVGLPTIATRMGEMPHVIEDGVDGFLVTSRDEMIDRMVRLAREPELRARMGACARARVLREFSLDLLGMRLAKIVKSCIQGVDVSGIASEGCAMAR